MPNVKRAFESLTDGEYEKYLIRERGLALATRVRYVEVVRRFLEQASGNPEATIGPEHVSAFIMGAAPKVCPRTLQMLTTARRSFLRFLFRQGLIVTDLASSVPTAPNWNLVALPRYLPPDQVERLLESCDRTTSIGRQFSSSFPALACARQKSSLSLLTMLTGVQASSSSEARATFTIGCLCRTMSALRSQHTYSTIGEAQRDAYSSRSKVHKSRSRMAPRSTPFSDEPWGGPVWRRPPRDWLSSTATQFGNEHDS